VFHNVEDSTWGQDAMPFYVLLALLVLEKFSSSWQKDKFGCGKMVEIYESIEKTE
jgi:hypothetical protein